jgi:diguanylate cyclase (GGDEF)-like protein
VADRLRALLRTSDTVARLGGDEFVLLLDGVAGPDWRTAICEGIAAAFTRPFDIGGHVVDVGVSIGVAVSDGTEPAHLLRGADAEMYRAKAARRLQPSRSDR